MASSADVVKTGSPTLPRRSLWSNSRRTAIQFAKTQPLATFGLVVIVFVAVVALFAPVLAPKGYDEQNLLGRLRDPSAEYYLGTDDLGRDILSRLMYGARVTMFIDVIAVAIATFIAGSVGIISANYGGKVDLVVQRIVDAWMSLPSVVVALSILIAVGSSWLAIMIVIGCLLGIPASRVIRSAALGVMSKDYIAAARVVGANDGRIVLRHILPNVLPVMIISASVSLGSAIIIEASLSYLGYGVRPPYPSWGQMLGAQSLQFFYVQPWLTVWPGICIALTVFAFNVLGDGLRDTLDPRLRGG